MRTSPLSKGVSFRAKARDDRRRMYCFPICVYRYEKFAVKTFFLF